MSMFKGIVYREGRTLMCGAIRFRLLVVLVGGGCPIVWLVDGQLRELSYEVVGVDLGDLSGEGSAVGRREGVGPIERLYEGLVFDI